MSAHYKSLAPFDKGEEIELELGIAKFALTANVAGMDEQSLHNASHLASMSAWGIACIAEKFTHDEVDAEAAYQLSYALTGIKTCLAVAEMLHSTAGSVRIRRSMRKATAKAAKAGAP